jgi:very-short-patch-repair endonuclease
VQFLTLIRQRVVELSTDGTRGAPHARDHRQDVSVDHVAEYLAAVGGSAPTRQLVRHFPARGLAAAVAGGDVLRVGQGLYALASVATAEQLALKARAVLFGRSAALAHGLGVLHRPELVELAVPRGRRVRPVPGTRVVTRLLPPVELVAKGAVQATSVIRTVLDCAAGLPFAEGLAIADSALRLGKVRPGQLHDAAHEWVGRNRRAQQRVLAAMDGRAANPFESGLRAACLEAGVVMEPQVRIKTAGGEYRVDLAKLKRLVAEADSFEWHGGRESLHRDCARYNELVREGCTVLRFSWEHVMFEQAWIGEVISAVDRRV